MSERTRETKKAWSAAVEKGRRVLIKAEQDLENAEQAERVEAAA